MKKFFNEFKAFAMRGNVIDLAVGVVVGGAFGKITTSLVNDIIMPLISMITGGVDFTQWKWVLKPAVNEIVDGAIVETAAEVAVARDVFFSENRRRDQHAENHGDGKQHAKETSLAGFHSFFTFLSFSMF